MDLEVILFSYYDNGFGLHGHSAFGSVAMLAMAKLEEEEDD